MNVDQALQELSVNNDTLTQEEKKQLDEAGFVLLRDVLTREQVASFNARLDELLEEEGEQAGIEMHQEAGTERLARLINKDSRFNVCFTNPRVLAAVRHVLGNFRLCDVVSRFALPGQGAQSLHADAGAPEVPGAYIICNTFWLLDDFTPENGPTRVVPGTHKTQATPNPDVFTSETDGLLHHPDEIQVLAPAGTVVIFNSHMLHGGTLNRTSMRRRAISSFFSRRDHTEMSPDRNFEPSRMEGLSEAARYILGMPL